MSRDFEISQFWQNLQVKVAACSTKREDTGAGEKVIEWFFFDGVDAEAGTAAIGGQHHFAANHCANKTGGALALMQFALARA